MFPKVAIVYLSYNGIGYLDEVLYALRALDYPKDRLEFIFVDNGSHDGCQDYLRKAPDITFFPNEKNLGFAQGNNMGIEHALLHEADYVFLHNNDLKLDPGAIKEAVRLAESDATIGSVQSLMCLWKKPEVINSTGGMVHFLGFGFVRENGLNKETVLKQHQDGEEIAYASGAAVLYRASALKKVGLLDPFLFLYHEDVELGWRLRLVGYRNVLSIKSQAYHDYEFSRSVKKFFWMERNRWLVHLSHLHVRTLFLMLPGMILLEPVLLLFALKGGWIKEKLLVYRALLSPSIWWYIAKKRRESRRLRHIPDRQIVSQFVSRIEHQETNSVLVTKLANPLLTIIWTFMKRLITW